MLEGGDPSSLTFGGFVGVAFAIFVAEYQRLGMDLITAVDKVMALGGGEKVPDVPTPADNARSMQQLMGMLGGVKGAPV